MTRYSYAVPYSPAYEEPSFDDNYDIVPIQSCFTPKDECCKKECDLCVEAFFKLLPCKGVWLIGLALLALVFGIASLGLGLEVDELVRIWLTGVEPIQMTKLGVGINLGLTVVTFLVGIFLVRTSRGWSTVVIGSGVASSAFAIAALSRVFVAYDSNFTNEFPFYLAGFVVLFFLWVAFLLSAICVAHCACCAEKEAAIASSIAYFAAGYATWLFGGVIATFVEINSSASLIDLLLGPFYIILTLAFLLIIVTIILAFRLVRNTCPKLSTVIIGALAIVTPITLLGFLRLAVLGYGGNLVTLTPTNVSTLLPFAYLLSILCLLVLLTALTNILSLLPFAWATVVLAYAIGQAITPIIQVALVSNANVDYIAALNTLRDSCSTCP